MSINIKYAEKLEKITHLISNSDSIASLVTNTQTILENLLIVELSGLFIYDKKSNKLKLMSYRGFTKAESMLAEKTAMERHPGWVYKNKKTILIKDTLIEKNIITSDSKRRWTTRSIVCIPILTKDECIGIITLSSAQPNKFNTIHVSILNFVALLFSNVYLNLLFKKDQEEKQEKLLNTIEEIKKTKKLQERFLANLSHEIRTPLNTIIGISTILKQSPYVKKERDSIKILSLSAENLKGLINDILDFSKIEANEVKLEMDTISIKELIENALFSFKEKINIKNLEVKSIYDSKLNLLLSDKIKLNQVILNILSNAIKFTAKGTISLSVKVLKDSINTQKIAIVIKDTGIGITKEKLGIIFEPFQQEDTTITRKYGGTGLGLSLSKNIINLLGGELDVKSTKNKGSSFKIEIELKKASTPSKKINVLPKKEIPDLIKQNPHILLVEDDDLNIFLIEKLSILWGITIEIAKNGKKAIEILKIKTFDLILMDVQMPLMDGVKATKFIRENLKLTIPIIGLTANAVKSDQQKCLNAGMTAYVTKPFDADKLKQKISDLILESKK
jgi:signal transduction histidine kinase/ActR/RegA family two-component response regulator